MWKRKELKAKARKVIKKNYWSVILVCAILAIVTGEFGMSSVGMDRNDESFDYGILSILDTSDYEQTEKNDLSIPKDIENIDIKSEIKDIIVSDVNSALKSQKYIYKIVDAVQSFNSNSTVVGVVLCVAAVIAFLFIVFVADPLIVGGRRFFIKIRKNSKTKINILISIFKPGEWMNIAKTMLLRNIYTALWYLTIIGGVIKTYEYRMIPYILAENPTINTNEAFKLSKQMMKGNKWKTFILDLSFILWDIVSVLTFGLLSIFYVNPYIVATNTELYITLKEKAIEEKFDYYEDLITDNKKQEIAKAN